MTALEPVKSHGSGWNRNWKRMHPLCFLIRPRTCFRCKFRTSFAFMKPTWQESESESESMCLGLLLSGSIFYDIPTFIGFFAVPRIYRVFFWFIAITRCNGIKRYRILWWKPAGKAGFEVAKWSIVRRHSIIRVLTVFIIFQFDLTMSVWFLFIFFFHYFHLIIPFNLPMGNK